VCEVRFSRNPISGGIEQQVSERVVHSGTFARIVDFSEILQRA
jgi:hypothetical protein